MKDKITQIRGLLDSLEEEATAAEDTAAIRMWAGRATRATRESQARGCAGPAIEG